jgi:hypothetical protein
MAESNEMEAAGQSAIEELRGIVAKMTPEQKQGFTQLVAWFVRWYMKAGYKHLCRPLIAEFK